MKTSKREVLVEASSHTVAIAQARAFSAQTHALGQTITPSGNPKVIGDQIAFLVLVGLTLELYFKAFMIRARAGRVTIGHDLTKLLEEFPSFLRAAFATEYLRRYQSLDGAYTTTAIIISKNQPATPQGYGPAIRFDTFDFCIDSFSDAFTRFRYLFEDVSSAEWTHIPFPNPYALAAIQTMEAVYVSFERGEFKSKQD